jgi:adenine specific DNA methylase Mod
MAFTEHGVAMLSSVLNSEHAIRVNIAIMRAFVQLRRRLATHEDLARKLAELEKKYDAKFRVKTGSRGDAGNAEKALSETSSANSAPPRDPSPGNLFDNRLIFGDNLLALKTLEQEFTGKIKCIYIDPPYNTGSAFTHYDDEIEHSLWLTLIEARLEIL